MSSAVYRSSGFDAVSLMFEHFFLSSVKGFSSDGGIFEERDNNSKRLFHDTSFFDFSFEIIIL